jgi:hypothetical protein
VGISGTADAAELSEGNAMHSSSWMEWSDLTRRACRVLLAAVLVAGCKSSEPNPGSAPSVSGTWRGTVAYSDASAPIEFTIVDNGGTLTGQQTMFDPVSHAAVRAGTIKGASTADGAHWSTMGNGLVVTGTFVRSTFTGSATFNLIGKNAGTVDASISLSLVDGGTP